MKLDVLVRHLHRFQIPLDALRWGDVPVNNFEAEPEVAGHTAEAYVHQWLARVPGIDVMPDLPVSVNGYTLERNGHAVTVMSEGNAIHEFDFLINAGGFPIVVEVKGRRSNADALYQQVQRGVGIAEAIFGGRTGRLIFYPFSCAAANLRPILERRIPLTRCVNMNYTLDELAEGIREVQSVYRHLTSPAQFKLVLQAHRPTLDSLTGKYMRFEEARTIPEAHHVITQGIVKEWLDHCPGIRPSRTPHKRSCYTVNSSLQEKVVIRRDNGKEVYRFDDLIFYFGKPYGIVVAAENRDIALHQGLKVLKEVYQREHVGIALFYSDRESRASAQRLESKFQNQVLALEVAERSDIRRMLRKI